MLGGGVGGTEGRGDGGVEGNGAGGGEQNAYVSAPSLHTSPFPPDWNSQKLKPAWLLTIALTQSVLLLLNTSQPAPKVVVVSTMPAASSHSAVSVGDGAGAGGTGGGREGGADAKTHPSSLAHACPTGWFGSPST